MKDNILYDDNLQGNMLSDLQAMLDEALQAPDEERDYDSIAEITAAIAEIAGGSISDDTVSVRAQETAEQVVNTCRRKRISRVVKWAAALSACFAISLSLNLYSFTTFGVSAVEAAVRIVQNGFSVDLSKETYESEFLDPSQGQAIVGQDPTDATEPGGSLTTSSIGIAMLEKCRENGFFPCYPKSDLPFETQLLDFEFKDQADSQDFYFTFTGEDAQLESCYTADLGFIDYTPFNYILQEFYNPDYSEITGFELSFNGREDSFTCDSEALAGTMNGTAFDLNDQDTLTAFQNFYRSFSNVYLSDIDIEAEPELKDPILTVVYHLKDGGDRTYQLTDAGNGQAYIFADGEFTCQLMDQEALTGKNSLLSFFEKFRDTIGTE